MGKKGSKFRKEGSENRKGKKTGKNGRIWKAALIAAVCLIAAGSGFYVYSKYYKTGYNKGMAIASGFYFSGSYMATTNDIKGLTMQEIAGKYLDKIISSANSDSFTDMDYTFPIEVRNYDNHLLFNDKDLNVEYVVNFMLLDETGTARYTVEPGNPSTEASTGTSGVHPLNWNNGNPNVVTFTGTLDGGKLSADAFNLKVTVNDESTYEPSRILMVAYPVGPEYLKDARCIAGIVRANHEQREFRIEEDTGFLVRKESEYETDWKAMVDRQSGYKYRIITSGNYISSGASQSGTRQPVKVKWLKDMYKINEYDMYYLEVKDNPAKYYTDPGDSKWQVMEIEILPYASLDFIFYRNDKFEDMLKTMSQEEFEKSVQVELMTN